MIRGIVFDCFGVLYHGSLDHLRDLAPPKRIQEITDLSRSCDHGFITQAEYFEGVGLVVGKSTEEVASIVAKQHVRNDVLIAYVKTLKPAYKIGLLSNIGRGFIDTLFTKEEQAELFDALVLSSEEGVTKPSAEAYQLVAGRMGVTPDECVMVDDSPRNVDGAQIVGMQGIVYGSLSQLKHDLAIVLKGENHA